MHEKYDVFNGGIELLIKDLEQLKRDLVTINGEIANELGQIAYENIMASAGKAHEQDQRDDIRTLTERNIVKLGEESLVTVSNPSEKVTFAEFGYGIVGKGYPYKGDSVFNMKDAGWRGYDRYEDEKGNLRNTKNKEGYWRYRDRGGELHQTNGELPTHIFFYSSQIVTYKYVEVTRKWLERALGKALK